MESLCIIAPNLAKRALIMSGGAAVRLATIICFDADFTAVARLLGRQGAQVIADPSLFGRSIAEMPYTQIVFRAIVETMLDQPSN